MKYKVGDKVKIVSLHNTEDEYGYVEGTMLKIGETSIVSSYYGEHSAYLGDIYNYHFDDLELIEGVKLNTNKVIETIKGETEMNEVKVETTTPKFKKGDVVVRTGFSYEDGRMVEGGQYTVHSCIGNVLYLEDVYDKEGELDWFAENNFDLVKAYEDKPSAKFKKGDKVKVVGETKAMNVKLGEIYTVANPCHHTGSFGGKKSNYVSLEDVEIGTPNEDCLELYIEPRNYRNMKPTDLIKVNIDGFEGEIPLGDLIHSRALIANAKGTFGYNLYMFLGKLDEDDVVDYVYEDIEVFDKQEELMKDFFIIEADKANLKELISNKQNELKELQDKLNQLEN
ncbi:MAG: hypothetical protein RSB94_07225 [Erysipelotrichaceae bacterium]